MDPLCPKVVAYIVFFWNKISPKIQSSNVRISPFWLVLAKKTAWIRAEKSRFAEVLAQVAMIFLSLGVRKGFCEKTGAVRSLIFIGLMQAMNWIDSDFVLWEWYTIDFEIDFGESMGSLLLKRWFHLKHSEIHGNLCWKSMWWYLAIDTVLESHLGLVVIYIIQFFHSCFFGGGKFDDVLWSFNGGVGFISRPASRISGSKEMVWFCTAFLVECWSCHSINLPKNWPLGPRRPPIH